MAEHAEQLLIGRPRCVYIGGTGRLEFELANGQIASVACDVLPAPEPKLVVEEAVVEKPAAEELAPVETEPSDDEGEQEKPKQLKGKLPEGFPALAHLNEAGIFTHHQLRKERDSHDQSLCHIPGIKEATDLKIAEALEDGPPDEKEESGEAAKE